MLIPRKIRGSLELRAAKARMVQPYLTGKKNLLNKLKVLEEKINKTESIEEKNKLIQDLSNLKKDLETIKGQIRRTVKLGL